MRTPILALLLPCAASAANKPAERTAVEVLGFTADGGTVAWREVKLRDDAWRKQLDVAVVVSGEKEEFPEADAAEAWLSQHPLIPAVRGRRSRDGKLEVRARGPGSWAAETFRCKGEVIAGGDEE